MDISTQKSVIQNVYLNFFYSLDFELARLYYILNYSDILFGMCH